MAFVNPEILQRIMGGAQQFGQALGSAPKNEQEQLWQMLAGAGAGMSQAAAQPGASFGQALGGGAQGMMQGQQSAQQMQANRLQMEQAKQEMERQERIRKMLGDSPDFAARVDARPAQMPQIGPAQTSPYSGGPGAMTARYESGGGGVGTVSTGQGDPGGVSYGTNQLSSNAGTMANFLQSPEGQPFAPHFSGQEPGSDQFNQSYQEVVQGAGPEFEQAQQQYLQRTHVAPVMQAAQQAGMPVDNPAIQAALHSQATQHSGDGNLQILNETMARVGPDSSPEDILDTLYDVRERYATGALQRSGASEEVIQGVQNRYRQERQETLGMLGERQVGGQPQQQTTQPQQAPLNGYQQRALEQQAGNPFANLPAGARELLSAMDPDTALKAAWDMQSGGGDTPDRIREAQMIAQQTGEPVGTVLARMRKIYGGGEDELTTANQTLEQRIAIQQRLNPDVDPKVIENSMRGRYKPVTNPVDGSTYMVDTYQAPTEQQPITVDEGTEEEADVDISQAFGAPAVFSDWLNTVSDVIGRDLPQPQVEDAKRRVTSLGIQGDVLLSEQFTGRVSNQLLNMIGELKAKPTSFFEGPARGKTSLEEMRRLIDRDLDRQVRIANDDDQGPQARRRARAAVEALTDYRGELDSVLNAWGSFDDNQEPSLQGPESGGIGQPPEGVTAEEWEALGPEGRQLWQN